MPVEVFLTTGDPQDIVRFPKGAECEMTIDRKVGAPGIG
jgi:hypothetical protein